MHLHCLVKAAALACVLVLVSGCASTHRDPLKVTVAGIEPVKREGLGMRMMVNFRVQNPNDSPVNYDGMAVEMTVEGDPFASGVSDTAGSVPRFGETVVGVPLTISAWRMIKQAMDLIGSFGSYGKIDYKIKGKLNVPDGSSTSFTVKGEFDLLPD